MSSQSIRAAQVAAVLRDQRWPQIVAHDEQADGRFWYSVRSTGVYCRPSCAARPPRPENVAFHASREDAERAGFRPCKRCRPDQAPAHRENIRYTVLPASLGRVLVAASDAGICAILFGDDASLLLADLRERFPLADLAQDDAGLAEPAARTLLAIELGGDAAGLALDVRGTLFQRRVWDALRDIPAGSTASYAEVARRIGSPRATRAVARACAANALAVLIPCHRVVRGDGSLSGYRWGTERKRALLQREAHA
jgi:AraC family transcriptional regulator of adaptative response/methylated-DNA-[protein]-cysteine methyltransferase